MKLEDKVKQFTTGTNPMTPVKSFGVASLRSIDASNLEKGNTFVFPENYKDVLFEQPIGENKAYYVLVEVAPNDVRQFYLSSLAKAVNECDQQGIPTGRRVVATGTCAEEVQQKFTGHSLDEVAEFIKGKKLTVSNVTYVFTYSDRVRRTSVLTIDYAE